MINYKQNLISPTATIIEAMRQLEGISETLTLFVVDEDEKLIGALTDGDIRRGFIRGMDLKGLVRDFMITNYRSTTKNAISLRDFKFAKDFGIRLLPELDELGRITKVYDLKSVDGDYRKSLAVKDDFENHKCIPHFAELFDPEGNLDSKIGEKLIRELINE